MDFVGGLFMSILDVEREVDSRNLQDKLLYIKNPLSSPNGLTFTVFVSPYYTYDEMILVKYCHLSARSDTLNRRQFYEYIVSLREEESNLVENFASCTKDILEFLATFDDQNCYQAIGCVHTNTDNLHAHIIVNNIAFNTGRRFLLGRKKFESVRNAINTILKFYGLSELVY